MSNEQCLYVVQRPDGVRSKKWSRSRIIQMFEAGKIPVSSVVICDTGKKTDIELFAFLPADEEPVVRPISARPRAKPKPVEPRLAQQPEAPQQPQAQVQHESPPLPKSKGAAPVMGANTPQWYYQIADERYGPITMVELRELAQRGAIQPIDQVWRVGMPTALPASHFAGVFPAAQQVASVTGNSPAAITVPLLISAISNVVFGLFWLCTIYGVVIGVPMFILAVFEFMLYAKIGTKPVKDIAREASTLAIWQMVLGFFCNIPTFVCGILLIINAGKYR